MARLPYVDPEGAPDPVRDALGRVPPLNVFRVMAHAETAFRPWLRWGAALLGDLALDPVLRELAILRVARITPHAEYEWVQHVPIARAVGVTDDQIDALRRDDPQADCFSPDQQVVLEFTTEVVRDTKAADATWERLAGRLPPREVIELLMVIGQYTMLARVMANTEIELDEPADPRGARG
jgi:alkylhydroperoxidase family enzyme